MIAIPKAISLRFEAGGQPVGYLMVQTDDLETAKSVARHWAEGQQRFDFDAIVEHQGAIDVPLHYAELFDGYRVWELPF